MSLDAKTELYYFVNNLRKQYSTLCYNRDIEGFCIANNISLYRHNFESRGLCGMALVGEKHDTIVLNESRNECERIFDFIHELIHTKKHRAIGEQIFTCFDKKQNSFLEWEANEGAAEFLVGYKTFIPLFCDLYDTYIDYYDVWSLFNGETSITKELAERFAVTEMVIKNRIKNLSYEIDQYRNGISIDNVRLLSGRKQASYNIKTTDYSGILAKTELIHDFENLVNNFPPPPPISVGI